MATDAPRFVLTPVGRNPLASMVKNMCQAIGVTGKTNHSLRATGVSRMFAANVPHKLKGHCTDEAMRVNETQPFSSKELCLLLFALRRQLTMLKALSMKVHLVSH